MRAIRARYNPYLQAKHRLEQVSMLHDMQCTRFIHVSCLQTSWQGGGKSKGLGMVCVRQCIFSNLKGDIKGAMPPTPLNETLTCIHGCCAYAAKGVAIRIGSCTTK